jgi:hypothetical protein
MLNGREIGLLEVDDDFTRHGSMLRNDGWADISNLCVEPEHRGVGIASWLLRHAGVWLRMGASRNLVSYLGDDELESPLHAWHLANGFTELNRTRRAGPASRDLDDAIGDRRVRTREVACGDDERGPQRNVALRTSSRVARSCPHTLPAAATWPWKQFRILPKADAAEVATRDRLPRPAGDARVRRGGGGTRLDVRRL